MKKKLNLFFSNINTYKFPSPSVYTEREGKKWILLHFHAPFIGFVFIP